MNQTSTSNLGTAGVMRRDQAGVALVMVVLLLSSLLALVLPFLFAVETQSSQSGHRYDRTRSEIATRSAESSARGMLGDRSKHLVTFDDQGTGRPVTIGDDTPRWDSKAEVTPGRNDLEDPLELAREALLDRFNPREEIWDHAVSDEASRIDLNTTPALPLATLLHRANGGRGFVTRIGEDVQASDTEVSVSSTAGWPDEGVLYVNGELVRYLSKTDEAFTECIRGLGGNGYEGFTFSTPRGHKSGTLVLDDRVHQIVRWRVAGNVNTPQRYGSLMEIRRLVEQDPKLTIEEHLLAAIADSLTVHGETGTAGLWTRWLNVQSSSRGGAEVPVVQFAEIGLGGRDSVIQFMPGQGGGGTGTQLPCRLVAAGGGNRAVLLGDPTGVAARYGEAMARFQVRAPVNVNTASHDVLTAHFHGLLMQGQAPHNAINMQLAEDLANLVLQVRGDGSGSGQPFRGFEDYVTRFVDPLRGREGGSSAWPELEAGQIQAIYRNARNPLDGALAISTFPLSFTSGVNYRVVAQSVANAPSGQTRASRAFETIVQAQPSGNQFWFLDEQIDFEDLFRLNREAYWMTTIPHVQEIVSVPLAAAVLPNTRLGFHLGNVTGQGPLFPYANQPVNDPRGGWGNPWNDEEDAARQSSVQALPVPIEDVYGTNRQQHFEQSRDIEGRDIGRKEEGPYRVSAQDGRVALSTNGGRTWPFTMSAFFEPRTLQDAVLFDANPAQGNVRRDRVNLCVENNTLVLRAYDTAGDDPMTAFEECSTVRLPLSGDKVIWEQRTPYHLKAVVKSTRPSEVALMVDGFPVGKSQLVTRLTSALSPDVNDLRISVEDASSFPPQGVLRIGNEIVEYSSKSGNTFLAQWRTSGSPVDSWIGGRGRRMVRATEFVTTGSSQSGVNYAPQAHVVGTTVELYGYASLLYSNIPQGGGSLVGDLGPFAVAKMTNNQDFITALFPDPRTGQQIPVQLGRGLLDTTAADIELTDPSGGNASAASAFQTAGGYALLIQNIGNGDREPQTGTPLTNVTVQPGGGPLGGIELIKYSSRSGNRLQGVTRAYTGLREIQNFQNQSSGNTQFFNGAHAFVTNWSIRGPRGEDLNKEPRLWTWIVPISVRADTATESTYDPATSNAPGIAQIYDSRDEGRTEWIQYDEIHDNCFVRSSLAFVNRVYNVIGNFQMGVHDGAGSAPPQYEGYLGYPDSQPRSGATQAIVEALIARDQNTGQAVNSLMHRGRFGTYEQLHFGGAQIHPVIQVVRSGFASYNQQTNEWNGIGLSGARPGRNDRISFMPPRSGGVGSGGSPSWKTVNWAWTPTFQNRNTTLVALKERNDPYQLDLQRQRGTLFDTRDELRLLKFPSGELPDQMTDLSVGDGWHPLQDGNAQFDGWIDELEFDNLGGQGAAHTNGANVANIGNLASYTLVEPLTETGVGIDIQLDRNGLVMPQGRSGARGLANTGGWAQDAGVVQIGEELLVYDQIQQDTDRIRVRITSGGRGFLDSKKHAHGIGDTVIVRTDIEVSLLANALRQKGHEIQLMDGQGFPTQGTLLIEEEVCHYTQKEGKNVLRMPRTAPDPGTRPGSTDTFGAFRGRYGTTPASHQQNVIVYRLPFRYWDRLTVTDEDGDLGVIDDGLRIADLPESAYLGFSLERRGAFFQALHWDEDLSGDGLLDVWALARIDGDVPGHATNRVPWDAVPVDRRQRGFGGVDEGQGDLLLYAEPGVLQKQVFNPINRAGDRLDVRFYFRYAPGAFRVYGTRPNTWKRTPRITEIGVLYKSTQETLARVRKP